MVPLKLPPAPAKAKVKAKASRSLPVISISLEMDPALRSDSSKVLRTKSSVMSMSLRVVSMSMLEEKVTAKVTSQISM